MAEDVVVLIPFSKSVRTTNLKATVGTVLYDEVTRVAKWTIGKLTHDTHPQLNGSIILQPNSQAEETPPFQLEWKVPMASVSGLSISSLQLVNERYKPYKGVRTIAKSGRFQIRTA